MFVQQKLKKLRKMSEKEIAYTAKSMTRYPTDFDADARFKIERVENDLRKAMAADDPAAIAESLRNYKRQVDEFLPFYRISVVREYVEAIVIALVLALFIRQFIVQAFKIPSGSMIPTLLVGDHILVNKFIYGLKVPFIEKKLLVFDKPDRGDIIVFKYPRDPSKDYIKRVVGLPGDKIDIYRNHVVINGTEVFKEPLKDYIYKDQTGEVVKSHLYEEELGKVDHDILIDDPDPASGFMQGYYGGQRTWVVPEGKYFVMGDNRDRSSDSRYWDFVGFDAIKGKAFIIYFSWPFRQLKRIGHLVK